MDYRTASKILRDVNIMPGWSMNHWPIDSYTMAVEFQFLAPNSSDWPTYERKSIAGDVFELNLDEIETALDLHRIMVDKLVKLYEHEVREFYRVSPTWVAPFHPHTNAGNLAWETYSARNEDKVAA